MSEIALASYPAFNEKVKVNKREVIKTIEKKVEDAKLELLIEALKSNNIPYDESINDYQKLVISLRKTLVTRDLSIANGIIDNINTSIDGMVSELEKGSESAFTSFLTKVEKIVKPIGNTAVNSLAMSTLLTIAPTPLAKLGVGIALTGVSLVNMLKIDKYKVITNKTFELNKILEELEITKDKDGVIIDTRFGMEITRIIKDFLHSNNIQYDDTGYLSLREVIYHLDNDLKERLCHVINQLKGNEIDVSKRLEDVNSNLLTRSKDKFVKPMVIGAGTGAGIATSINAINPGIISSIINTAFVQTIVNKFTNSPVISWIAGLASGGVSFFGKFIPCIGTIINEICAIENLGVLAIAGAGVGIFSAIGKSIYNAIINRKKAFQTQKDMKAIQELDLKLYGASDIAEIKKIQEIIAASKEKPERIIVNIVCEYMDELGISYSKRPNNLNELKQIINLLDKRDKKKVNSLLASLEDFLKREPNDFKRCLKKSLKWVGTLAVLGLASMSIINILTAGEFLDGIKREIFKTKGYNVPPKIPEFDDSEGIKKAIDANNERLLENGIPTATSVNHGDSIMHVNPEPAPAPMPSATPAPNVGTVSEIVAQSTPKINIDDLVINGTDEAWNNLSSLSTEELYNVVSNAHDPVWASRALQKLSSDDFLRLKEYMETSADLIRTNTNYYFLKDAMIDTITSKNDDILKMIDEITKRIALEKGITEGALILNGAMTLANEENKEKVKTL